MDDKTINAKGHFLESLKDFFKKDLVQYIVKRLFMFVPTLFLISILAFFVIQLPETDYVDREIAKLAAEGEFVTQEEADALRAEYGLDLPIHERYIKWISGIIWTPTDSSYYRLYGSHHDWKDIIFDNNHRCKPIQRNLRTWVQPDHTPVVPSFFVTIHDNPLSN